MEEFAEPKSELVVGLVFSLTLGGFVTLLEGLRGKEATLFATMLLFVGLAFALQRWTELKRGASTPSMTIVEGISDLVVGGVITLLGAAIVLT